MFRHAILFAIFLFSVMLSHAVAAQFDSVKMLAEYQGEQYDPKTPVQYLTPEELERHRVNVKDGIFYDYKEIPLDTCSMLLKNGQKWWENLGMAVFVVDLGGNMYVSRRFNESDETTMTSLRFQHSSFLSGQPVACAGKVKFENGRLVFINNDSGHYEPQKKHLDQVVRMLQKAVPYNFEIGVVVEKISDMCGDFYD